MKLSLESERRRELFRQLTKAISIRKSFIPQRDATVAVKRARRVVKEFDRVNYNLRRRGGDKIDREAERIRTAILFGELTDALKAIKKFAAGRK